MRVRARHLTWIAAAVAASVTLITVTVPAVPFAFRNPSLHIALDTAEGLIAAFVAYLLIGRLRQSGRIADLILILALGVLSATNLMLATIAPDARAGQDVLFTWVAISTRLIGTGLFAASAFLRGREGRIRHGRGLVALAAAPAIVAFVVLLLSPYSQTLPLGVELGSGPSETTRVLIEGHPALLGAQLVTAVLFLAASIGFTRRAQSEGDDLMRWLGAGSMLAAFARVNFLLFPSLYSNYVYTGDVLRLGFYLFLLVGAMGEIVSYWESRAQAARLEERRKVARDLHDGIAQELVVVASQSRRLERANHSDGGIRQLVNSVERAVGEARRAISALSGPTDEPLHRAITDIVEQIAERTDSSVDADLDGSIDVPAQVREHLVRVVREALTNAIRHARPSAVAVRLRSNGTVVLEVFDDGIGFEVGEAMEREGCFGLIMMQERARAAGGELTIRSDPGAGTLIRVELP